MELNKNWSLNYLARRDVPEVLSGDIPAPAEGELVPSRLRRLMALKPNHGEAAIRWRIRIHGVPPGRYDRAAIIRAAGGCLVETIGEKVVSIEAARMMLG
jgi:hypothetical protein